MVQEKETSQVKCGVEDATHQELIKMIRVWNVLFIGIESSVILRRNWVKFLRNKIHSLANWWLFSFETWFWDVIKGMLSCLTCCLAVEAISYSFSPQAKNVYSLNRNDFIVGHLDVDLETKRIWYHQWFKTDEYYER